MPLYEYECEACGERFEVIQRFSDAPAEICVKCNAGPVRRLLSSPAIQFKGSGWYITDYAKKGKSESAAPTGQSDAAAATPDAKPEAKPEAKPAAADVKAKPETKTT